MGHTRTVSRVAGLARDGVLLNPQNAQLKLQLVVHAALRLVVLVVATVLSIYKPWGQDEVRAAGAGPTCGCRVGFATTVDMFLPDRSKLAMRWIASLSEDGARSPRTSTSQ
jgi:hypothetical protein